MGADLQYLSAAELVAEMEGGQLSAVELMAATLEWIDQVNPQVNAIVSREDRETLMAEAAEKDRVPFGERGLLHGLPIAAKDFVDVAGFPTSQGSPLSPKSPVKSDDILAGRMRNAGAIFIGKTNVPEFGFGSHTFNSVFGTTRNPYDLSVSAGGSSGGAGVALASGMISVADGSDMMGSLRNPAAWNNVYGMRPSIGRVPQAVDGDMTIYPIVTDGPMARNPRDLARLLQVQSGPHDAFPNMLPTEDFLDHEPEGLKGKRIAWLRDWGGAFPMEPGILELSETALSQMEALGAHVHDIPVPFSRDAMWESWTGIRAFLLSRNIGDLVRGERLRSQIKPEAIWEAEQGFKVTAAEFHRLSVIRSNWFRAAAELFSRYDLMALPSAQVWPFPCEWTYPKEINGKSMDTYHRWMEVVMPASVAGLPAISVPIGFGDRGLPMGLQLIGRHGNDLDVIAAADHWHQATDWPNARRPKLTQ